jgi:hypothetical protein
LWRWYPDRVRAFLFLNSELDDHNLWEGVMRCLVTFFWLVLFAVGFVAGVVHLSYGRVLWAAWSGVLVLLSGVVLWARHRYLPLLDRLQTPAARQALEQAFAADPETLGKAAQRVAGEPHDD